MGVFVVAVLWKQLHRADMLLFSQSRLINFFLLIACFCLVRACPTLAEDAAMSTLFCFAKQASVRAKPVAHGDTAVSRDTADIRDNGQMPLRQGTGFHFRPPMSPNFSGK